MDYSTAVYVVSLDGGGPGPLGPGKNWLIQQQLRGAWRPATDCLRPCTRVGELQQRANAPLGFSLAIGL